MCPFACWLDIFPQIDAVDPAPDASCRLNSFINRQLCIAMEIGGAIAKCRLAQSEEAFDVPLFDVYRFGIYINGEIEKVGDEEAQGLARLSAFRLQDV